MANCSPFRVANCSPLWIPRLNGSARGCHTAVATTAGAAVQRDGAGGEGLGHRKGLRLKELLIPGSGKAILVVTNLLVMHKKWFFKGSIRNGCYTDGCYKGLIKRIKGSIEGVVCISTCITAG